MTEYGDSPSLSMPHYEIRRDILDIRHVLGAYFNKMSIDMRGSATGVNTIDLSKNIGFISALRTIIDNAGNIVRLNGKLDEIIEINGLESGLEKDQVAGKLLEIIIDESEWLVENPSFMSGLISSQLEKLPNIDRKSVLEGARNGIRLVRENIGNRDLFKQVFNPDLMPN